MPTTLPEDDMPARQRAWAREFLRAHAASALEANQPEDVVSPHDAGSPQATMLSISAEPPDWARRIAGTRAELASARDRFPQADWSGVDAALAAAERKAAQDLQVADRMQQAASDALHDIMRTNMEAPVASDASWKQLVRAAMQEIKDRKNVPLPAALSGTLDADLQAEFVAAKKTLTTSTAEARVAMVRLSHDTFQPGLSAFAAHAQELESLKGVMFSALDAYRKTVEEVGARSLLLRQQDARVEEIELAARRLIDRVDPNRSVLEYRHLYARRDDLLKMVALYRAMGGAQRLKNSRYDEGSLVRLEECLAKPFDEGKKTLLEIARDKEAAIKAELRELENAATAQHRTAMQLLEAHFPKGKTEWLAEDESVIRSIRGINSYYPHKVSPATLGKLIIMHSTGTKLGIFEIHRSKSGIYCLHASIGRFAYGMVKSTLFHIEQTQ